MTAAILAPDTGKELRPSEAIQIRSAYLIQFLSAGIDFIKFDELIATIPIVGDGGVYMRDLDTLLAAPDMPIISTPLPPRDARPNRHAGTGTVLRITESGDGTEQCEAPARLAGAA